MYETFFHLTARPFASAPDPAAYFPAATIEQTRQTVLRCVERCEGLALVIGAPGAGKTLLCKLLQAQLSGRFETVELIGAGISHRRGLYQSLLRDLRLPYRLEEGELRLSLADYIAHGATTREGLVILIDEAQALSVPLVEELRLLTNLARDGQPWTRVVLVGTPELEERLASPKLESFNQRIAARCYLQPFTADETRAYVTTRIAECGAAIDGVFTGEALGRIYHATDGIPRLVNQVCDHALVLAYAGGTRGIDAAGIEEAWSDLQQLPAPFGPAVRFDEGHENQVAAASVIEFGSLDDEDTGPAAPAVASLTAEAVSESHTIEVAVHASDNLERIEAHLGRLEQEYTAEESMKPHLAFAFRESGKTGGRRFEEEEIVVDRYAELDAVQATRPRVQSQEGRSLWPMLQPFAGAQPAASNVRPATTPPATATRPRPAEPASVAASAPQPAVFGPTTVAAKPLPQAAPPAVSIDNDDDLIVVEEDIDTLSITTARRPPVRRQEYRQLFAKLRRG